MGKTLAVSSAVVCCLGLYVVGQLSAQPPQAPHPPANGTALVDMSAIMKHSTRFNQAMEQLKKHYEAKSEELRRDAERGNQLTQELRTLPPSSPNRRQLEQKLMADRADYELKAKRVTADIRDRESKIILGLLGELKRELDRYARSQNIRLVLRNDPTPPDLTDPRMIAREIYKPIVYQSRSDVTPAILGAINGGTARTAPPRTGRVPPAGRPAPR